MTIDPLLIHLSFAWGTTHTSSKPPNGLSLRQ